jgi:hypothetical protein
MALRAVSPLATRRLSGAERTPASRSGGKSAPINDVTAILPKGVSIYATAVAGEQLVLMPDIGGQTEIRTFDAKMPKPAGRLKFTNEP